MGIINATVSTWSSDHCVWLLINGVDQDLFDSKSSLEEQVSKYMN